MITLALAQDVSLELVTIPAGEFWMGTDRYTLEEKPGHEVSPPEFCIGKYLVTAGQYAAFLKATDYPPRPGLTEISPKKPDYPVVYVTWHDAQAFCRWIGDAFLRGIDKFTGWQARLPSEAEWEKAARGTDGREFPWGDQQPDDTRCNYNHNLGDLSPVGHFSPLGDSPYGCADMAGNVWEWTHSLFKPYPYQVRDGREFEDESGDRVVRGGSMYNFSSFMRCTFRSSNPPDHFYGSRGFRMCVSPVHI
ncbi:MAG TPA: SUMF1/EgtB/PvdO family nonheme iron enzyme [Anaerolineaceae bacterium]|nr:SUMF1/EgtB/PvdO family nonheme iron enzyme [Anaerolineaceae bacterium]